MLRNFSHGRQSTPPSKFQLWISPCMVYKWWSKLSPDYLCSCISRLSDRHIHELRNSAIAWVCFVFCSFVFDCSCTFIYIFNSISLFKILNFTNFNNNINCNLQNNTKCIMGAKKRVNRKKITIKTKFVSYKFCKEGLSQ